MNVNNDKEFENLFKRSSEQYPLRTDSADWEDVLSKLEKKDEKKAFAFRKSTLLILLLLVGIFSSIVTNMITRSSLKNKMNKSVQTKITTIEPSSKAENKIADAVYQKVIDSLKKYPTVTGNATPVKDNKFKEITKTQQKKSSIIPSSLTKSKNTIILNQFAKNIPFQDVATAKIKQTHQKGTATNKITSDALIVDNSSKINEPAKESAYNQQTTDSISKSANTQQKKTGIVVSNHTGKNNMGTTKDTVTTSLQKRISTSPYTIRNFYIGGLYAKDNSSIKLEPNRGKGYSWSILLGYRFSKKLSIETGLHIEKKEYYSSGNSFVNKTIIPSTGNLLWVESENELLEIPITLKADILKSERHNLFATIGLSSYIVNREYYEFEEEINGVLNDGSVLYTNQTNNIFATTNFSLGYQYKVGKIGSLRIEPYINLPLSGIGKSKEHIISKGIYLGWIYDFPKIKLKH